MRLFFTQDLMFLLVHVNTVRNEVSTIAALMPTANGW